MSEVPERPVAPPSLPGPALDVTDRVSTDARLRASGERFELLARATNDTVWDHDLVTDDVWRSDGFAKMMGLAIEEERSPAAWVAHVHPDDRARVHASYRRAIDGDATRWVEEYRLRCADGTYRPVRDRGYVFRGDDGRALRIVGGVTDISEERATAARLAEQAALIDESGDAILLLDAAYRVILWSRGAEVIYGWPATEAVGRRLPDLLEEADEALGQVTAALAARGEWAGELQQRTRDGHALTVLSRWIVRRSGHGAPCTHLVINTDITERKHLEAQFFRAQRLESLGVLAGGIAHDLNNVLAPVVMAVDLLRAHVHDRDGVELIASIQDSLQRGAAMIRQVLSFARGAGGRREAVAPATLVGEVQRLIRNTFPKNIALDVRVGPDVGVVTVDPTQVHQVLMNLCVNARDAMPEGGTLTLSAEAVTIDGDAGGHPDRPSGPYVAFTVTDTGVGITPVVQDRLFEPFFTTKPIGQGTGLGLSTSIALVRAHGGFIEVSSEPGQGASFRVYLPAGTPAPRAQTAADAPADLPRGHGECVLFVDDEAHVRLVARTLLERAGYRVRLAADGGEAIDQFSAHRSEIAVVFTDMMMPGLDGPALIQALRGIDPAIRIVASSGLSDEGQMMRATSLGVAHFVPKPYRVETLLRVLRDALSD